MSTNLFGIVLSLHILQWRNIDMPDHLLPRDDRCYSLTKASPAGRKGGKGRMIARCRRLHDVMIFESLHHSSSYSLPACRRQVPLFFILMLPLVRMAAFVRTIPLANLHRRENNFLYSSSYLGYGSEGRSSKSPGDDQ